MIVGEIFMSDFSIDKNFKINKKTILNRLSETDAFDKILAFKNKDILEIVLTIDKNNQPITYCFQFKNGIWKNKEYCPFELCNEFDEKEKGKIIGLQKKSKFQLN